MVSCDNLSHGAWIFSLSFWRVEVEWHSGCSSWCWPRCLQTQNQFLSPPRQKRVHTCCCCCWFSLYVVLVSLPSVQLQSFPFHFPMSILPTKFHSRLFLPFECSYFWWWVCNKELWMEYNSFDGAALVCCTTSQRHWTVFPLRTLEFIFTLFLPELCRSVIVSEE